MAPLSDLRGASASVECQVAVELLKQRLLRADPDDIEDLARTIVENGLSGGERSKWGRRLHALLGDLLGMPDLVPLVVKALDGHARPALDVLADYLDEVSGCPRHAERVRAISPRNGDVLVLEYDPAKDTYRNACENASRLRANILMHSKVGVFVVVMPKGNTLREATPREAEEARRRVTVPDEKDRNDPGGWGSNGQPW